MSRRDRGPGSARGDGHPAPSPGWLGRSERVGAEAALEEAVLEKAALEGETLDEATLEALALSAEFRGGEWKQVLGESGAWEEVPEEETDSEATPGEEADGDPAPCDEGDHGEAPGEAAAFEGGPEGTAGPASSVRLAALPARHGLRADLRSPAALREALLLSAAWSRLRQEP